MIKKKQTGFTIVELLIVIVVIGILAAISIVAYSGVQAKARTAKISSDLGSIGTAIRAAHVLTGKTTNDTTGNPNIPGSCTGKPAGTDLAALPRTDVCWTAYISALDKLSIASDINIRGIVDPWGRPYVVDGNEGEMTYGGGCIGDQLATYAVPFAANARTNIVVLPIAILSCP